MTGEQVTIIEKLKNVLLELGNECLNDENFNLTIAATGIFKKDVIESVDTLLDILEDYRG